MGPTHTSKSTRAKRGRSADSSPKPRRKPIINPLHNPLLRRLADMHRDNREQPAEAILKAANAAKPARTSAVEALQRQRELIRPVAGALREIRQQLDLAHACAIIVEHALLEQNVELDHDAALVLKRCVGDELDRQIERIDILLGNRDPSEKDANAESRS